MLFSPRLFLSTLVCSVLVTGVTLGESKHTTHWHSDLATARFVPTRRRVCCCRLQSAGLRKHPAVRLVLRCNVAAAP